METKAEVLKYMFTRIQEMLPVNVVKAKKNKDYFTYIVENDCSIEFYFQTTQGGYAGKNTFCMGVSAKIKNPYLCLKRFEKGFFSVYHTFCQTIYKNYRFLLKFGSYSTYICR